MKILYKEPYPIYQPTELDAFLGISPLSSGAYDKAREQVLKKNYPREELFKRLSRYNSDQNCPETQASLQKLQSADSCCIVTGQQLGLMGGPSYTILKALTTLLMAEKYQAVPLFWLATEDHDQQEIDHTYLLDYQGNLDSIDLGYPQDRRLVEDLQISPKQKKIIEEFCEKVGFSLDISEVSYSQMMASVLKKLFKGTGLLFLEPRLLRDLAAPFFVQEVKKSEEIRITLESTTARLIQQGGKAALPITSDLNLFYKSEKGHRLRIQAEDENYKIGKKVFAQQELIDEIYRFPERFSTNVASRPVLQSLLIPTLAYVAGPGEISYYHQLKDYHELHGVSMPWIYPRHSGTFISPLADHYLYSLNLPPWDDLSKPWNSYLPQIDEIEKSLKHKWEENALESIPSQYRPFQLKSLIDHSVNKINKRVLKKFLKEKSLPSYGLHYLRNLIHPQQKLQERVLNWFEFQRHTKINLIEQLLKQLDLNHQSHFYCYYE